MTLITRSSSLFFSAPLLLLNICQAKELCRYCDNLKFSLNDDAFTFTPISSSKTHILNTLNTTIIVPANKFRSIRPVGPVGVAGAGEAAARPDNTYKEELSNIKYECPNFNILSKSKVDATHGE